jgi:15-cis-phytoene synthase
MKQLYDHVSIRCSRDITRTYSTSFSLGIRFLAAELRDPIYSIYGFVRVADEIVDSFQGYRQKELLERFEKDTFLAIDEKISTNPVLHAFQDVVHRYDIDRELIGAFLYSMSLDLDEQSYTQQLYEEYIYGSAEVVGLMCLKVFCGGERETYESLKGAARKLGSAFQKINFLRDINADYEVLGRTYFPQVDFANFSAEQKAAIEADVEADFNEGFEGLKKLPAKARFGVFLAYMYYKVLFRKIRALPCERIMNERVRVPNTQKATLLLSSYIRNNLNLL